MNKNKIGEYAGIVWRALHHNSQSWEELVQSTGLTPLEVAAAIGWLAREDKIIISSHDDIICFDVYHEYFPFKIQTKLDNSLLINFSFISLCQDAKRK